VLPPIHMAQFEGVPYLPSVNLKEEPFSTVPNPRFLFVSPLFTPMAPTDGPLEHSRSRVVL